TVNAALGPPDRERNRFGLFVGNAQSVLVQANRVIASKVEVTMEAIRLTGVYGRHVIVRDNHLTGTRTGISFTPKNAQAEARNLWVFEANLGEGAADPLIQCNPNDVVRP